MRLSASRVSAMTHWLPSRACSSRLKRSRSTPRSSCTSTRDSLPTLPNFHCLPLFGDVGFQSQWQIVAQVGKIAAQHYRDNFAISIGGNHAVPALANVFGDILKSRDP